MKIVLTIGQNVLRGLVIALALGFLCFAAMTSAPVHGQSSLTPTPTLTVDQVLDIANQTASDAANTAQSATGVVTNADSAVNTSNRALIIATGAMVIGMVLVVLIAYLALASGLRTLTETRKELANARTRIAQMRSELNINTAQVRDQADRAIRSLAMMQLGEQQLERRNIAGAIKMYAKAVELDPGNHATNYFLGELYLQDKQLEKGIEQLQQLIGAEPLYAPAQAALGLALRLKGDEETDLGRRAMLYVQAEEQFLRALKLDPTALDIHGEPVQAGLGGLYKRQGRVDQAIECYEQARLLAPKKSYPIVNLAILYYMQGNLAKAQDYFQRVRAIANVALETNAYDYWARFDRLTAELALSNPDSAFVDLDVVAQQVRTLRPLEAALAELQRLQSSPQPPPGIATAISRILTMMQKLSTASA
jgi:tetratricopeptide (TPR) repeat protein